MAGFLATGALLLWPRWQAWRASVEAMADAHLRHDAAHPGWSFPARVWSAPAEADLPRERFALEARARGYAEACPPSRPGEFCPESGDFVPRGGLFPEGRQPAGREGWTRPLALEPVLVGTLVGPDAEWREHLPLDEAPRHLLAAIVAAEDEDFREHHGVNLKGALRAAWANLRGGGIRQGASTLTMQVVRAWSQDRERTFARKLREALSALVLDDYLGKDGVIQAYLDAPYLGQHEATSVCGFQAAARYYWGVDARDLDLAQAATLAAILPAPGRFAPDRHPEAARERRDRVLRRIAELGWDADEVAAALAEPVGASPPPPPPPRDPAYLQATRAWLEARLPPEVLTGAGLEVFTAMDVVAQERTEAVLPERTAFLERNLPRSNPQTLQSAGVLLDTATGLMVAAWGGSQALPTDFSRATQARRQSGSAIKPLIYAMAFSRAGEDGHPAWTAGDTLPNQRRTFPGTNGWRPRNVGGEYSETTTLAMGLAWSQNVATASLLEKLGGPEAMIAFARRFGFDTASWPHEMGLALGQGEVTPLEMARFVATIARGGLLASGRPVIFAVDAGGRVRVPPPGEDERVLGEEAAALTRELMRLVIEYGTGGASRGAAGRPGYPGPAIGKTGTTDHERDVWFVGATPTYAGAVWIGYDQPARLGASASDLAAPLWGWWMRAVHAGLDTKAKFDGLKVPRRLVCTETGLRGNGTCKLIAAPFLPGTAPTAVCPKEHPPPEEAAEEHHYEGLWKRKAREEAERRAAEEAADRAAAGGADGDEADGEGAAATAHTATAE